MDLGLRGKVAIVTGGSDGIGKAAATALSAEGARVAICARRPGFLDKSSGCFVKRKNLLRLAAQAANRHRALLGLAFADHQDHRHLGQ